MDIFSSFLTILFQEITDFYNSGTFAVIKFIMGIYITVVVIDIILLFFQRGFVVDWRENFIGINIPKELTKKKKKLREEWEKIVKRLESENESEYKVAIIEADNLVERIISRLGHSGNDLKEKLDSIPEGQLDDLDKIKEAHEVRNKIIHEENFNLSKNEARKILDDFAKLLHFFEVLD